MPMWHGEYVHGYHTWKYFGGVYKTGEWASLNQSAGEILVKKLLVCIVKTDTKNKQLGI